MVVRTELFVFLQNFHEITSVEDAHYYLQRLAGMGAVINQYRINSKVRANKGIIVPAYAFDPLIQGTQSLLNGSPLQDSADENSLYRDFKTKISTLEIADKDKSAMLAKAEKALKGPISKAINSLINELKRQQKHLQDEVSDTQLKKSVLQDQLQVYRHHKKLFGDSSMNFDYEL